jgi:hypothetical protein
MCHNCKRPAPRPSKQKTEQNSNPPSYAYRDTSTIMSTPIPHGPGQRNLDMLSQDSLMDDSEVEDPMSPSPSPVKKQVKRRKQSSTSSSACSAGSASRAGSGSSGAAAWNKPLRTDTSRDKRKGKRPSPSTATNVGAPCLSGKSVLVVVSETLRHCSYSTLHVNLSHSFRSYAHDPLLHNRRTRNTTDGKTKGAIRRRLDEHPLPIPAVLASF